MRQPYAIASELDKKSGYRNPAGNLEWTIASEPKTESHDYYESDYAVQSKNSSSTSFKTSSRKRYAEKLSTYIKSLFSLAENIEFEVGMTNQFSDNLENAIEVLGIPALLEIKKTILNEETSLTVAAETMRYIGNIESNTYRTERRELLETCLLNSRFVWVKDGAAVGLSYIDDPESIGVLKIAIEKEEYEDLKQDMILVLEQLEDTLLES